MASSSEPLEIELDEAAVQARAEADVRETFVENTRRWRSPRAGAVNVLAYLLTGLLPAIPGADAVFGIDWRLSLGLMVVHSINTVVGVFVIQRFHPLSVPGKAIEVFGTTWWIGSAAVMMAASGSAKSVFWFHIGVIIVALQNTIHHHRRVFAPLFFWVVAIVLWFAANAQWGDVAVAVLFGWACLFFQRLSTIYGWRYARERARVALMQEKLASLLVSQERRRIERELHDGVAAELTAALWQARSLEGVDQERVESLASGIEESLGELRRVVLGMRGGPATLGQLSGRIEDESHKLVAGQVPLEVEIELEATERAVTPERAQHVLRVLQESLRNALTHARATRLRVAFRAREALHLEIEDDGGGLAAELLTRTDGGLANVRARAAALGGEVRWDAIDGGGTRVTLSAPVDR